MISFPDFLMSVLNSFLHLVDPIVHHWNLAIYSQVPKGSLLDCAMECESDLECQLFIFETGICQMGNGTTYDKSIPSTSNNLGGVYVNLGT